MKLWAKGVETLGLLEWIVVAVTNYIEFNSIFFTSSNKSLLNRWQKRIYTNQSGEPVS